MKITGCSSPPPGIRSGARLLQQPPGGGGPDFEIIHRDAGDFQDRFFFDQAVAAGHRALLRNADSARRKDVAAAPCRIVAHEQQRADRGGSAGSKRFGKLTAVRIQIVAAHRDNRFVPAQILRVERLPDAEIQLALQARHVVSVRAPADAAVPFLQKMLHGQTARLGVIPPETGGRVPAVRTGRNEHMRITVLPEFRVKAVRAGRPPDEYAVELFAAENIQILLAGNEVAVRENQQDPVALRRNRLFDAGQNPHQVLVLEHPPHRKVEPGQHKPENAGAVRKEPPRIDVRHIVERAHRVEDLLPGRGGYPGAPHPVAQHPRNRPRRHSGRPGDIPHIHVLRHSFPPRQQTTCCFIL